MGLMRTVDMGSAEAHIRAGDADRERAAENLTGHCADGRLTPTELEARLDAAFRARTLGELAALSHDLPPVTPVRSPRRQRSRRRAATVLALLTVLSLTIVGLGALELVAEEPLGALLVVMLLVACALFAAVVLGSLLVTLAPLIALGVAVRWLAQQLVESRNGATSPWSLRA